MFWWLSLVACAAGMVGVYLFHWSKVQTVCFVGCFVTLAHFAARHDYGFLGPHWASIAIHFGVVSVLSFAAGRLPRKREIA
jgi:hypothetical protein